ncbi:MAG: quinoprotein dehydrogenase-associated SoxYZ-like carrier [Pseudomonadota bacterium]
MTKGMILAAGLLALGLAAPAHAGGAPERPSEAWNEIRDQLWPEAEIAPAEALIDIDAPTRAADAAIVPVTITLDPAPGRFVTAMTVIVDENPAPVAAEFEFGDAMAGGVTLSTRLRVNAYSNVRVVATLDDGSLHQTARFVKASGGCAAPAAKDAAAALASLGKMKLRRFDAPAPGGLAEAQVMVRHPNNSGFQVDQVSLLHIPAHFVDEMEVTQGGQRLFRMTGGISISEDPAIRFTYRDNGAETLEVYTHDTDGGEFRQSFPVQTAS